MLLSHILTTSYSFFLFFFNDTATTEIYTLSLHDALPISGKATRDALAERGARHDQKPPMDLRPQAECGDRKSTRLNSSHVEISYAVFCLKKKKKKKKIAEKKAQRKNIHIIQ